VNGITHQYYLDGSQIIAEMRTEGGVEHLLYYLCDETGSPLGMQYRTSNYASGTFDFYFFEKNLQGDIVAVYNSNGKKICTYTYDAWGNCTTTRASGITSLESQIASSYNPFRYRGYYYDTQTGFYYLQSRYYNPEWGRFLNADACLYSSILGFNMFAYCDNNPVNYIDPYGESGVAAALAGWASSAWGLTLVDGPLPIGDIIYAAGCVVLGVACVVETAILVDTTIDAINTVVSMAEENTDTTPNSDDNSKDDGKDTPAPPDVDYPGDDPTKAPDGYKWTGKDSQGGKRGGYKNPNGKDSWHPDLDHPDGVDPHWDYNDENGHKWRIFPDGSKKFVR